MKFAGRSQSRSDVFSTNDFSEKEHRKAVKQAWSADPAVIGDDASSTCDSPSVHSVDAAELP